ncbi:hypothetical protein CDV55_106863 [Aspergillus turcosus]|nr:hypothetical protein CDV55_106863 [Aspergillus turcosus]
MHFTNHLLALLPILTVSLASPPTARARIWAEFFPSCPINRIHPASAPDHLPHEEFISALNLSPGTCAPIYVPLSYGAEVTHMSFDAEVEVDATGPEAEKCTISVHEVPGCVDPPLLEEEVEHGFASSDCVPRNFVSYNQVWVRLDCEDAKVQSSVQPIHKPLLHDRPLLHVNKTMELGNQTVANLTAPYLNSTGSGTAARSGSLRRALRIRV